VLSEQWQDRDDYLNRVLDTPDYRHRVHQLGDRVVTVEYHRELLVDGVRGRTRK
jgi:hypothetical protein